MYPHAIFAGPDILLCFFRKNVLTQPFIYAGIKRAIAKGAILKSPMAGKIGAGLISS